MNKKDIIPIAIILCLFLAWPYIDRHVMVKFFPPKAPPPQAERAEAPNIPEDTAFVASDAAATAAPAEAVPAVGAPEPAATPVESNVPRLLEFQHVLENENVRLVLSSHGAGVVSAEMLQYPATAKREGPVFFDFSDRPAAAPIGYGLPANADFEVAAEEDNAVAYRKVLDNGAVFHRRLTLEGYQLQIEDTLENRSGGELNLIGGLQSGWMVNLPGDKAERMPLLGVDSLTGTDVSHWGGKFEKWFPLMNKDVQTVTLPGPDKVPSPIEWAALKNKYFVQILTLPEEIFADHVTVSARRGNPVATRSMLIFPSTTVPLEAVNVSMWMPSTTVAAGGSLTLNASYYLGPKLYANLVANGPHQADILELGFFSPIGRLILRVMVWFKEHIWPFNYGISIILLTFLIRILFWPLNHKSMMSTRHMQQVQPQLTAMKEKFKNDPQKQQQEMMRIYKEHKINPMGGCLPMLVQIPVFFALFVVLRGAIELRFSSFLWIADLSTPENLFRSTLGIPINILPILMGLTMWIQQKLTPTSDPQQQKMMMMMPVIFTLMFYNFPSGLSLYWTTNQVLMIIQLSWMHHRYPTHPKSPAKA